MNIQFSNWKLIDLNALDNSLVSALGVFENIYNSFDATTFFVDIVTNTKLTGTSGNYDVVVLGSNFTTDVPFETYTSISLINSTNTAEKLLTTGSVTYNYDTDTFSGFYNKLSYVSDNTAGLTNLLIEGKFNVDSFGDTIGGTATKYNFTFNGNTLNLAGNFLLDANNEITGGTVSSFTFADNQGHMITANGLSLSAVDFNNLTDPAAPNSHLNLDVFYNYLTDATRLAGNDTITANASDTQNDTINGFGGNDILGGGGGNDILNGGLGADTIDGGTGIDTMDGGDGNDTYIVDDENDTVIETNTVLTTGGTDTVKSRALNYTLTSNVENLILTNNIDLNGGNANINGTGNALNNIITGNAGNNVLDGAAGNDTLNGGDGSDTLIGGAGIDKLTGGKGNDTYNIDLVRVSALATSAVTLQDTVSELANPLNSTVEGIDTIILTNLTGNAGAPIDTFNIFNATMLTVNANIENFNASQTGNFKLNITGNALANTITGNTADNILDGGLNDGKTDTLIGGTGNDTYLVDIIATTTGVAPAPIVVTGAQLQDSIVEVNGTTDGIDTLKLRGTVTIPPATAATNIALTGALANIENLDISLTGSTKLNITGNASDNTIIGNAANNTLSGNEGSDNLYGGAGDDTLNGGDAGDLLDGGTGADVMNGGDGNDVYVVDVLKPISGTAAFDQIIENDINLNVGIDTVQTAMTISLASTQFDGIENIKIIGTGNTNATGDDGSNQLFGNAGNNILNGGDSNDGLIGGAGNDTLNGGTGADGMQGGLGNDLYIVDNSGDYVYEDESYTAVAGGIDTVQSSVDFYLNSFTTDTIENLTLTGIAKIDGRGNALNNIITGNAGDNTLRGDAGNDTLIGGDGSDTLIGGAGIDKLTGGKGNDTYNIDLVRASALATSTVALQDTVSELANPLGSTAEGIDTIVLTNLAGNAGAPTDFSNITTVTTLNVNANVENFDASQTGNIKLNITGNTLANTITGNDADNVLDGGASTTIVDNLTGGAGNDTYVVDLTVTGTGDATTFTIQDIFTEQAGEGTDTLRLRGTLGYLTAQTLYVDNYSPEGIIEGLDVSLTGSAKINLTGNSEDNILIGNAFTNTLIGDAGNDILDGKAGADILNGGAGDDTYFVDVIKPVGAGGDVIIETTGNDTVKTTFSADLNSSQFDGIENMTLLGTALNATGDDGDNDLIGNASANNIKGGAGDDEITGGAGNDILTGGFGADTFVWELADKGANGRPTIDKVTDFNSTEDKLDLRDLLVGESSGNILNYLDVTTSLTAGITNTEIRISNTGGFTSGNYSAAAENQHITLVGVNLLSGTNEADLLANLITQNKLIID